MIYVEWLRARKRLALFTGVLALFVILAGAVGYFGHVTHVKSGGDVSVGVAVGSGDVAGRHAERVRDMIHYAIQSSVIPLGAIFALGAFVAVLFTTLLYTSLHAQRGSLDLVFTKPTSRWRLASAFFAIDFLAIVACYAATALLALLWLAAFGGLNRFVFDAEAPLVLLLGLGTSVLLYGLMQLVTASLRGAAAGIITAMWIVFIVVASTHTHVTNVDAFVNVLRRVDPLYYFSLISYSSTEMHPEHLGGPTVLLWVLGCSACALAAFTWQRVEL